MASGAESLVDSGVPYEAVLFHSARRRPLNASDASAAGSKVAAIGGICGEETRE